jgi:hypothetical protein
MGARADFDFFGRLAEFGDVTRVPIALYFD